MPLRPLAFRPLAPGAVRPAGWLRRQLILQRDNITGRLDEIWPDVGESGWIGGPAEAWERAPYWLDGLVPLAFTLGDEQLIAKARRWIDHIIEHQQPDGWLGPVQANPDPNSRYRDLDPWPRYVLLKALVQWQEATGDGRIVPAMTRFARRLAEMLRDRPLREWARARWADLVLSLHWLYERTGDEKVLALAAEARRQGLDWPGLSRDFPYTTPQSRSVLEGYRDRHGGAWLNDDFGFTHGVNVAMGVKAAGVAWRQSGDDADHRAIFELLDVLDEHHGQATGVWAADEHLAGRSPSQGTELCAVVELMFSLQQLVAITGEASLADRLERIAFNALPATFSADMRWHQYDQQANQVVCRRAEERIYMNNGRDANLFGLEPLFGCCLANLHQGWPKLGAGMVMHSADDGLAIVAYGPCEVEARIHGHFIRLIVETDYPFADEVTIRIETDRPALFPIHLRIPGWCEAPELRVAGKRVDTRPGTFHRLEREWHPGEEVLLKLPGDVRATRRYNGASSFERGPIVFALPIGEEWRQIEPEPRPLFEVHPTTPWQRGVELSHRPRLERGPVGEMPFAGESPPLRLHVVGRAIGAWEIEKNAAAPPPRDPPLSQGPTEALTLVPYGCTRLRVTELPALPAPS